MKCPEHRVKYQPVHTSYEQLGVILKDSIVQLTVDSYQANLTGVYAGWLRAHIEAYNHWAQNEEHPQLALAIWCSLSSDLLSFAS
jgi:ribosomal protein S8E